MIDLNRRKIITTAAGIAACSLSPSIVLGATDDEKQRDYERYRRQFVYDPNAELRQQQQSNQQQYGHLENKILPFQQQADFWAQPRRIYIQRRDTGEKANIIYHQNGEMNPEGYYKASYMLRDIRAGQMIYLDFKLLDLMCAVQAWLIHYGSKSPLLINSGFRSRQTNSRLEGAAKNSMHLYGKAVDFTVPGFDPVGIAKIAAHFKAGGIGIYPTSNFTHLDTGGVRVWVRK